MERPEKIPEQSSSTPSLPQRIFILGGPAKAGKSTLASKWQSQYQFSASRFYRWEANPDGEGFWSSLSNIRSSQQAVKKELFSRFKEIVDYSVRAVSNLWRLGYTIVVSLGGIPSPENEYLIRSLEEFAPVLCLLYPFDLSKLEKFNEWVEFSRRFSGVDVIIFRADRVPLRL